MDNRRMPERETLGLIASITAKVVKNWELLLALAGSIIAGAVVGTLEYLRKVRDGKEKWSLLALFLALTSSAFLSVVLFIVGVEVFNWSPILSVACGSLVSSLGYEQGRDLLTKFFTNKFT